MSINVIVNGAHGKMGKITAATIKQQAGLNLVAELSRDDDLAQAIKSTGANVVVDFTIPDSVFRNTQSIIAAGARPIVGTTGLQPLEIKQLQQQCIETQLGGIIAPNFSLAAILMMRYAADAAKYFADAEIIEMHHPQKLDAPSGTAKKTAELMAENRQQQHPDDKNPQAARGEQYRNIPIHSVRLPGLFAHQEVIFGGSGETLTIRHDAMDRKAMMPGVILACHKVMDLKELVYGLETIL